MAARMSALAHAHSHAAIELLACFAGRQADDAFCVPTRRQSPKVHESTDNAIWEAGDTVAASCDGSLVLKSLPAPVLGSLNCHVRHVEKLHDTNGKICSQKSKREHTAYTFLESKVSFCAPFGARRVVLWKRRRLVSRRTVWPARPPLLA